MLLRNSACIMKTERPITKRRYNFFALSFYIFCSIFSSIASKLRDEIQKNLFLENRFLWKLAIFREKRSKFPPFSRIFYFSSYLPKHVIDLHHLVDFQHNLAYISGIMALKVPKISQFWIPNFLIMWKMHTLPRRISWQPSRILRRRSRRWNRNEKYFRIRSSHFFDPGPPPIALKWPQGHETEFFLGQLYYGSYEFWSRGI